MFWGILGISLFQIQLTLSSLPSFTDPRWNDSWHLHPGPSHPSMKIREAWGELGLSGEGVRVLVVDNGIDRYHPDLYNNYDSGISYDFYENDTNPHFVSEKKSHIDHGTNVAGVIAAAGNNSVCGVGIAFKARIGMARVLNPNGASEGFQYINRVLDFKRDEVDLIVMSIGPSNQGLAKRGLSELNEKTFKDLELGRNGKGSILMLSTGNGGQDGESCSFNGLSQSIHTISINAVGRSGVIPPYAERCSSVMASAFGSAYGEGILTIEGGGGCKGNFTGTSSGNAVAGGVMTLALEANPRLTWRDAQHLLVRSVGPKEDLDPKAVWVKNAAGFHYSPVFGFGLMDAYSLAKRAASWKTVPPQINCTLQLSNRVLITSDDVQKQVVEVSSSSCRIRHLEHVQVELTAYSLCRGNVNAFLESPGGTRSTIMNGRKYDFTNTGFNDWPLLSLGFWGESPVGTWTLGVFRTTCIKESPIALRSWNLVLYGTEESPEEGN